jgi:hypothetical protein
MLDVHPPHEAAHTWKDFFIHVGTICIGLLIAIGLEQSVEFIHHRHEAAEARHNIQHERAENIVILQRNLQRLGADQKQLATNLDLLNAGETDAEILPNLQYSWYAAKPRNSAWNNAKIDGSLALIPSHEITNEAYFYASNDEIGPIVFNYFTDIDVAAAIVDQARRSGKLPAAERQQLGSLTTSAMGLERVISRIYSFQLNALQPDQPR